MSAIFFALAICVLATAVFVLLRDPARKQEQSATKIDPAEEDEILQGLLLEMELDAIEERETE